MADNFYLYEQVSGKIICNLFIDDSEQEFYLDNHPGSKIAPGFPDFNSDYVLNDEITPRPLQQTSIDKTSIQTGIDVVTISNAPTGATFTAINLDTNEAVSGPISGTDHFFTNVPGKIKLQVTCWPYLDWEQTIDAV